MTINKNVWKKIAAIASLAASFIIGSANPAIADFIKAVILEISK